MHTTVQELLIYRIQRMDIRIFRKRIDRIVDLQSVDRLLLCGIRPVHDVIAVDVIAFFCHRLSVLIVVRRTDIVALSLHRLPCLLIGRKCCKHLGILSEIQQGKRIIVRLHHRKYSIIQFLLVTELAVWRIKFRGIQQDIPRLHTLPDQLELPYGR